MPDELKVLAGHCLKDNPDDRPTAAILLNYADRKSLMMKAFNLRAATATTTVHDEDKSSVDAFYLDDGNPVAEHAGNQACRLLFESVASGLHYLHEEVSTTKFIHGDITSSNIMMKESTGENLKIIDIEGAFQQPRGLRPSKKEFNMQKGSFYFMSPEMAVWLMYCPKVTRPTPDCPTDIYSLGCVVMDMYFVSQGQALWPDHDYKSICFAMQSENPLIPRMPEKLPDELKVLARQCLQVNPSDRPTAATLLNYADREYFKCAEDQIHWYLRTPKKPLGQLGGFGVVHRVDAFLIGADLVEQIKQYLALKTFHGPLDKDEIKKIETNLLKLNHPNIVKYFATGFFENDRQFMLIMEWCSGGTLTEAAAAETALPVEMQKNYVNQLICGIHYLHMEVDPPIVHKDLKGTNVVFSDENKTTLKICDVDSCSVSRRVEQQSVISRVRFTPGFVSPELLKWAIMFDVTGDYPVGRATDIWSLGAVVLEMYNRGKLPDIPSFQRGEILRTTTVADANVDIPPIGEELLAFAAKCLVNEPGNRPSIKQLRDDFSKGFSSDTVEKLLNMEINGPVIRNHMDVLQKQKENIHSMVKEVCAPVPQRRAKKFLGLF
ncbi:putative Mitogen-activated protein kinase kinase kinase 2 [Hypsibius exemplaris]|uniref:Mitogen-activated protein kinase kinase kinase 2 n=1 Tax=Hypsibius exemplaris TaxID=2072580 RepID=A0A9X6NI02_HYPEX|nr:putative Mitogen-activated protein kinase kinase kinase 2 [Hypsibius exemplaris]